MTKIAQTVETTVFMLCRNEDDSIVEFTRTPFGEWFAPISPNASFGGDNLKRCNHDLSAKLEELYTQ